MSQTSFPDRRISLTLDDVERCIQLIEANPTNRNADLYERLLELAYPPKRDNR